MAQPFYDMVVPLMYVEDRGGPARRWDDVTRLSGVRVAGDSPVKALNRWFARYRSCAAQRAARVFPDFFVLEPRVAV